MNLKYRRNPFKDDKVRDGLETLARQQAPESPELGAIEVSANALLFIFSPPKWFRNEEGRIVATIEELLLDMERGHTYIAYLTPWVEEVKKRATEEQRQFLHDVGLDGVQEEDEGSTCAVGDDEQEARAGHDIETRPHAKTLPEPAQALSLLEALAQRYDPSTVDHTCLGLAVQTLRFLFDTHQVDALCAFLDEAKNWDSPAEDPERPALA